MSIRFRGGESLQRGRGIGGLLRLVKSVFSPIVKSFGTTALKAVTSKTGKKVLESIKDQAISSAVNMTSDVIKGNDLGQSFQNEVSSERGNVGDAIKQAYQSKAKNKDIQRKTQGKNIKNNTKESKLTKNELKRYQQISVSFSKTII